MNNFNTVILKNDDETFIESLQKTELHRLIDPAFLENLQKPYKIRVGYYLRVSTAKQAEADKVSLSEQEIAIKEIITNNKWEIYDCFRDAGISGSYTESRDGFNRMIADAKAGKFDVIMAWCTDRLARNVNEMTAIRADLENYPVQITTVKEPNEIVDPRLLNPKKKDRIKKLVAYVQDLNAELDNVKRVERFESGKLGKARKGKIPVKVPYGYRKFTSFENGDPKKRIEKDIIVEDKALIIREIFDLYDKQSLGMVKIASHLNLKGLKSPTGKKWCFSTIKYILQNPTYTGIVRWGWRLSTSKDSRTRLMQGHKGIIVQGQHEKIIETDQYNRVKEKIRIRAKLGGKSVSSNGLLTGILKCGRCGGGTYFTQYPNWHAYTKAKNERDNYTEVATYFCSTYANYGKSGCSKRYIISAKKIELVVLAKITELAKSKEARKEFANQMKKNNSEQIKKNISGLKDSLQKIDDKDTRLKLAYTNGAISLGEFSDDRHRLGNERDALSKHIGELEIRLVKEERLAVQSETALLALADFDKSWGNANFFERKALLQGILEKITVSNDKTRIE
jgi:site-specific DNA recombinase